ncbi:MAG: hypothetical protein AAGI23_08530 [Bacteroidota bacterium]
MRTSHFIFLALTLLLGFTACEQDNTFLEDAQQTTHAQKSAPIGADEYNEPMTDVQTFEHEQTAPELPPIDSTRRIFEFSEPFKLEVEQDSEIESRSGSISCNQSLSESTIYKSNKVSSSTYRRMGLNANLDGGDQIYAFTLTETTTVSFSLSNTTNNLAMILFEGLLNCTATSCGFHLNKIVARTSSSSIYGDNLSDVELKAGTYILVVDGVAGYASNYNIEMTCSAIGHSVFHAIDDFQSYYAGLLSPQSNRWSKWNNYATYDGQVVVDRSYKYLFMERKTNIASSHQPDMIYKLLPADNDIYKINFNLWVADNRSAYFSIQKRLSYLNQSNEFGAQVYFYSNGRGAVKIAGEFYYFTYQHNRWLDIAIDVRTDAATNHGIIYIDGSHEIHFEASAQANFTNGSRNVAALGFYPVFSDSKFWVDNIEQTNI